MGGRQLKSDRERKHRRIRAKISGTASQPRLSVFRSHERLYVQLIDDAAGRTLVGLSDAALPKKVEKKVARSFLLGEALAKKAMALKITKAVFDRGGYGYAGRVKALADGARRGGLKF